MNISFYQTSICKMLYLVSAYLPTDRPTYLPPSYTLHTWLYVSYSYKRTLLHTFTLLYIVYTNTIHTCMNACMHTYIHNVHTARQTDRQAGRQTNIHYLTELNLHYSTLHNITYIHQTKETHNDIWCLLILNIPNLIISIACNLQVLLYSENLNMIWKTKHFKFQVPWQLATARRYFAPDNVTKFCILLKAAVATESDPLAIEWTLSTLRDSSSSFFLYLFGPPIVTQTMSRASYFWFFLE